MCKILPVHLRVGMRLRFAFLKRGKTMKKRQSPAAKKRQQKYLLYGLGLIALGIVAAVAIGLQMRESGPAGTVAVVSPSLSLEAKEGRAYFKLNCQTCHGENAAGTDQGPPLIHDIYNPGHHSDESFYLAAAIGVRQHHWTYGDMPAQPQVSREEVALIIRYIRELQEANGITYKAHGM